MAVTPNTDVFLLKCPIELDNVNQVNFANASAQYNYFSSLPKLEAENFTYQRKDSIIRFPEHIDRILDYNYVMYRNTNYGDKWFYAFISDMQYINDNMTAITIKTDVWQTWQFALTFKKSFVEREHVADDTIGLHTVPESIETGEYIGCDLQPTYECNMDSTNCVAVLAVTELIGSVQYSSQNINIPTGFYYIGVDNDMDCKPLIQAYADAGKAEAVQCVFVAPKDFFGSWTTWSPLAGQYSTTLQAFTSSNVTVTRPSYVGQSYNPKNNKLLTFPYSYLQASNNAGTAVNYRWEDFNLISSESTDIKFKINGVITPSCSFRCYPINYKNILDNYDEGLNLGKLPVGSWASDVYTNWIAQNGINIGLDLINSTAQTAIGLSNPVTAPSALMGASGIASTLAQVYQHSLIPDQLGGNINCGDVNFNFNWTNITFKRMSIKNEYASIIDNYFEAYGYQVNIFKTPQFTSRPFWNYIKTREIAIEATVPQADLQEIKDMFNNGVTFWHNTSYFLDYSQNNSIVTTP